MLHVTFLLLGLSVTAHASGVPKVDAKARVIHERLIVLDTHLDTPAHLVWNGWSILDRHRTLRKPVAIIDRRRIKRVRFRRRADRNEITDGFRRKL